MKSADQVRGVRECLDALRVNGTNLISIPMLQQAMTTLGIPYKEAELARELSSVTDSDGDGTLEVHEFDTFFVQQAALNASGLDGALEPWDLGRSLAMDALPLATRSFTAHTAVSDTIRESDLRVSRSSDRLHTAPASSSPKCLLSTTPTKGKHALRRPQPSHFQGASASKAALAEYHRLLARESRQKPLPSNFEIWQDTRKDFAEYKKDRQCYESKWQIRRQRRVHGAPPMAVSASEPVLRRPQSLPSVPQPFQERRRATLTSSSDLRAGREGGSTHTLRRTLTIVEADALDDGRPRTGFFSQNSSIRGNTPLRASTSHEWIRPPRVYKPCLTSSYAAAATERQRLSSFDLNQLLADVAAPEQEDPFAFLAVDDDDDDK